MDWSASRPPFCRAAAIVATASLASYQLDGRFFFLFSSFASRMKATNPTPRRQRTDCGATDPSLPHSSAWLRSTNPAPGSTTPDADLSIRMRRPTEETRTRQQGQQENRSPFFFVFTGAESSTTRTREQTCRFGTCFLFIMIIFAWLLFFFYWSSHSFDKGP